MATKGTRNKKIEQVEAKTVLEATKDLDLTSVIGEVSHLQVNVQGTLAGLSAALTTKIQQLEQMDTAIGLKEQRLQELYGIENMAITLDEMKAQRDEEERLHGEQKAARAKGWMEEEAERHKKWKRELEEYEYARNLSNKKWKDDFDAEVITSKRNEQSRQEMLTKAWNEREASIKAREQEFAELQKQVADFDAKLKSEVAKAEAVVGNSLKREYTHQMELMKKDADAQITLSKMNGAAQDKEIQGLHEQIRSLQAQLTAARTDAKEVATQALQSASGRQVADALQRVVDTREPATKSGK